MIRVHDVVGASGDNPVVFEIVAERLHASTLESRHIEVRRSQAEQLGDGLESFKAHLVDTVRAWERGEEALESVAPVEAAPAETAPMAAEEKSRTRRGAKKDTESGAGSDDGEAPRGD